MDTSNDGTGAKGLIGLSVARPSPACRVKVWAVAGGLEMGLDRAGGWEKEQWSKRKGEWALPGSGCASAADLHEGQRACLASIVVCQVVSISEDAHIHWVVGGII